MSPEVANDPTKTMQKASPAQDEKEKKREALWDQFGASDYGWEELNNVFEKLVKATPDHTALVKRLAKEEIANEKKIFIFKLDIRDGLNKAWENDSMAILPLVREALMHEDVRYEASKWLASEAGEVPESAREEVLKALRDAVRRYGIGLEALIRIGGDKELEDLIKDPAVDKRFRGRALLLQPGRNVLKAKWERDKSTVFPLVLAALEDEDYWEVRQAALDWLGDKAETLSEIEKPNALKGLAQLLADEEDEDVRKSALAAIGRIVSDSAFEQLLSDSSIKRSFIGGALLLQPGHVVLKAEWDKPDRGNVFKLVLAALEVENNKEVRQAAADWLGEQAKTLSETEKSDALKGLAPRLADQEKDVRYSVNTAIDRIGGDSAFERLSVTESRDTVRQLARLAGLAGEDEEELGAIKSAISAINQIGGDRAFEQLLSDRTLEKKSFIGGALLLAGREVLETKWERDKSTVLPFIEAALKEEDYGEFRQAAADWLGEKAGTLSETEKSNALKKLANLLGKEEDDDDVRNSALEAIDRIGGDSAFKQLLSDRSKGQDRLGALLLQPGRVVLKAEWERDQSTVFPLVLTALKDEKPEVLEAAVDWLGEHASELTKEQNLEAINKLKGPPLHESANKAIKQLNKADPSKLMNCIQGSNGDVRHRVDAVRQLAKLKSPRAARILIQEWVNWIADNDEQLLADSAAQAIRSNPCAVQPLVDQLEIGPPLGENVRSKIDKKFENRKDINTIISLLKKEKEYDELAKKAESEKWGDDKLDELKEAMIKLSERKVKIRIAKQLADMSDSRFFDGGEEKIHEEIKGKLKTHAIPVLARMLPEEGDFEIRESLARVLCATGDDSAIEAVVRAVSGGERTRKYRQTVIEKYYLDPSRARSDEAAEFLKKAVESAQKTLGVLQGLNIAVFIVGMLILLVGVLAAIYSNEVPRRILGAVAGIGGLGGVITLLIKDPLRRIQNAMADLVQIETAFTSFIWELNLNGTYIQSNYVKEGVLTDNVIKETINRIESAMHVTCKAVADYTEIEKQNGHTSKKQPSQTADAPGANGK